MKKLLLSIAMFCLLCVSNAFAFNAEQNSEINLYEAYNHAVGTYVHPTNLSLNYLQVTNDDFFVNNGGKIIPISAGAGSTTGIYTYDKGNLFSTTPIFSQTPYNGYLGDGTGLDPYKIYDIPNADIFGMELYTNLGPWDLEEYSKLYSTDSTVNLGGRDHFQVYQVPQLIGRTYTVNNNGIIETYTLSNPYLVGVEDLDLGDEDFNDITYLVDSVAPYDPIASLQNQVTNVNNQQTTWNVNQDNSINNLNNVNNVQNTQINNINNVNAGQDREIANTNKRVDEANNRIDELDQAQFILGAGIRVFDTRKWQGNVFVDYSDTRNQVDTYGVRVSFKLGSSYEERRLDQLEARLAKLDQLEALVQRNEIQDEALNQLYAEQNYRTTLNANGSVTVANKDVATTVGSDTVSVTKSF